MESLPARGAIRRLTSWPSHFSQRSSWLNRLARVIPVEQRTISVRSMRLSSSQRAHRTASLRGA